MRDEFDKQELIDRYVLEEMDDSESAAFESRLAVDIALNRETELTRTIVSAIGMIGGLDALEAMKSVPKETIRRWIAPPQQNILHNRSKLYLRIATAAAALLLLFFYIGSRPRFSAEQLFAQYYHVQQYETWPARGGYDLTPEERDWMRQAETYYRKADFSGALAFYDRLFAQREDPNTLPEEAHFYSAICRLETGNLQGAMEALEQIIAEDTSVFGDDALWNLAFVYLKEGKRKKAKDCFEQLIATDSDYAAQASAIMEKMKKRKFSRRS